jgi:hypothetical protein
MAKKTKKISSRRKFGSGSSLTASVSGSGDDVEKKVIFIQYDIPPLKTGKYTVTLEQQVNLNTGNPYSYTRQFAVTGQRFTLNPDDLNAVFPPELANGEFDGVFPLVVFNKRTLPWERTSVLAAQSAPWIALLLFNEDEIPEIRKMTVKDLVPLGTKITVPDSPRTGVGAMPAGFFSYPGLDQLEYGETPDDPVNVIDIPAATFNTIVPSAADLPYLAHIRDTETIDKTDDRITDELFSVVLGNRIPKENASSYVFLVSLENFGDYLPNDDGTGHLPIGTAFVRLITYYSWHYFVNDGDQTLERLLENLNKTPDDKPGLSTLQYPFQGPPPPASSVQQALVDQANGNLRPDTAQTLVHNAFNMGFIPLDQLLRHPGNTVSWYRSPMAPYYIAETVQPPFSTPDAANRYNPETGMFDVSYGAAWQIGQLMALQSKAFANALYNWKQGETTTEAIAAEQKIIQEKYSSLTAFSHLFARRNHYLLQCSDTPVPDDLVEWLGQLAILKGVPFNYLVPDERMLPPESIRFFYMDNNWIDYLLDGAFSIGRSTTAESARDMARLQKMLPPVKQRSKHFRPRKPQLQTYQNSSGTITGFLLRSAVVSGWPGLEIFGYDDPLGNSEVQKLRMDALSGDTLICLFDGIVLQVVIQEPPEALHDGLVKKDGVWASTLRSVNGPNPGEQIQGAYVNMTLRSDNQTLFAKKAAGDIKDTLNAPPYNEQIEDFTSAEYALELIKGVVKVKFLQEQ